MSKTTQDSRGNTQDQSNVCERFSGARLALLFLVSVAMLTVIQAPINISFLAWISFVPFIIASSPEAKPRRLFFISYIVSLFYWLGNLYWIFPITIVGWLLMCLYTALLWPVLSLCLRYFRIKKVPLFLVSAVLIVGTERMQGLFLGGFFWRFLAHSQYQNTTIIQIADIFGAGGVSFLIAMVNGLIAELIIASRNWRIFTITQFAKIGIVVVLLTGCILYGRWRISQEDEFVEPGPLAASLQSNIPQSVKDTFESSDVLFSDLMVQSKAASKSGAELIIWPETMVQAWLNPEILRFVEPNDPWQIYDKELREHAKNNAFLLVGAYGGTTEIDEDLNVNLSEKFNSAFLYKKNGEKATEVYNKIHLVPFGEILPLRKSFSWFYEILMKIDFIPYSFDYSLDYGSDYTVFKMSDSQDKNAPEYKFSVIICYEDTVPAIARRFALDEKGQKQIDWLVNISNDGWFVRFKDNKIIPSTELPQHAAVCTFRAVENRLAIMRSVNTGISCLIDSSGRIVNGYIAGTLPYETMKRTGVEGWFIDRIPIDKRITFFSKYGGWLDIFCEICVLSMIILWLFVKFIRLIKRKPVQGVVK